MPAAAKTCPVARPCLALKAEGESDRIHIPVPGLAQACLAQPGPSSSRLRAASPPLPDSALLWDSEVPGCPGVPSTCYGLMQVAVGRRLCRAEAVLDPRWALGPAGCSMDGPCPQGTGNNTHLISGGSRAGLTQGQFPPGHGTVPVCHNPGRAGTLLSTPWCLL